MTCDRPPKGWYCTREADHDGPCAAYKKRGFWGQLVDAVGTAFGEFMWGGRR